LTSVINLKPLIMKKSLLFLFAMLLSGGLFSQMVLLSENMDSYATSSFLGVDNPTWFTTWSNLPGSGEDAQILTNFARSGTKSASADLTGGTTDCVLKLGDKTTGIYEVTWWMYVETGKSAYYNIQHFQAVGTEWAFEIYFLTNGTIHLYQGGSTINGTYPKNAWFEVKNLVKLDADSIYLYINGALLSAWPYHYTNSTTTGTKKLGAVDLFAGSEGTDVPGFYFDDVSYTQFGTLPPTVVTTAATGLTSNSATVNGTVNANIMNTTVTFEYGLTTAYGSTVAGVPPLVTGNTATAVSAGLTGLLPGNTYHYRVKGVNTIGTANGLDMTFTTPPALPAVTTTAATNVSNTSATLNGTVDASGASTTVSFDYGLTTAYGTNVPGTPPTVTGNGAAPVTANISGLTVNTTYHYRVKGVNSVGTSNGTDMTFFTTLCPLPSVPGVITGPVNVCCNSTGVVYSVPAITNATGYVWGLPPGAMITSGANTNTITVTFACTSGNVTVMGTNSCGNGTIGTLAVTVNAVPSVPVINGQASLCVNSGYYYYSTQSGFSNYAWTITAGGTIISGAGTNTIQVSWTTAGAQSLSVTYTNSFGCPPPNPGVLAVTVNGLPGAAGAITGTPVVCAGTNAVVYSVAAINGALSYVWTLPTGAAIISGGGTKSITVNFADNAVSGIFTVYGNNLCGNGAVSPDYAVTVNPIPPAPVITLSGYVLKSDATTGNQWYINGLLLPGATTQFYTAVLEGEYWDVVTLNNCSSDTSNHISIVFTGINELQNASVSVYPNPNDGQFYVKIASLKQESFTVSVVNNIGMKIMEIRDIVVNGNLEKNIDLRPLPGGIYSIIIRNSESTLVRKILVNK
jgi:hypothetical protein